MLRQDASHPHTIHLLFKESALLWNTLILSCGCWQDGSARVEIKSLAAVQGYILKVKYLRNWSELSQLPPTLQPVFVFSVRKCNIAAVSLRRMLVQLM